MSLFPGIGSPMPAAPLEPLSRSLFDLDFALAEWSPDTGVIVASSGHQGTFARGATLASISDAVGTAYTAVNAQPGFEMRDWDGDSVREAFGLRMGTSDRLPFPAYMRPGAFCWLLEFVETGAVSSANATLWSYTADTVTGARLWVDTSGTAYRFNYTDGTTTRTATLASGPTSGQRVQLYGELSASGVITIYQSINGGAAISANAAALTLPAAWVASASWRLNARGTGTNPGQGWYRRFKVNAGALDLARLLERR